MKNVCYDKVEQKSSCGDIEVGLLKKILLNVLYVLYFSAPPARKPKRLNA